MRHRSRVAAPQLVELRHHPLLRHSRLLRRSAIGDEAPQLGRFYTVSYLCRMYILMKTDMRVSYFSYVKYVDLVIF